MIDIHAHIIQNVDDGSKSIEASIKMLQEEIKNGVSDIILTPHYRRHMFDTDGEDIKLSFFKLQEYAKKLDLRINLYLGQEIYCRNLDSFKKTLQLLDEGKVFSLENTKYILLEFSYIDDIDITEIAYTAVCHGYTPSIAHIERYKYIDTVEKLKK